MTSNKLNNTMICVKDGAIVEALFTVIEILRQAQNNSKKATGDSLTLRRFSAFVAL